MRKRFQNIIDRYVAILVIVVLILIWQLAHNYGALPAYMLPSPIQVVKAMIKDFPLLMKHAWTTLYEAFVGLGIGVAAGFFVSLIMDHSPVIYKALYPILVMTQTVPTVAIAPLLVLWMGYGTAPKITLIVIGGFFPIAINLLDGYKSVDPDMIRLMQSMGASKWQIFKHVKFPGSMSYFFAGLRISISYSIVGAVISEWLGGFSGLGVYMTRVKKSFSYDKMFAVIFIISFLSLLLIKLLDVLEHYVVHGKEAQKKAQSRKEFK